LRKQEVFQRLTENSLAQSLSGDHSEHLDQSKKFKYSSIHEKQRKDSLEFVMEDAMYKNNPNLVKLKSLDKRFLKLERKLCKSCISP